MEKKALGREEVLAELRKHKPELVKQFGVKSLALFGPIARDEPLEDGTFEVLVGFQGPADWKRFFGVQFYIEDLTERQVVLITEQALRKELRPYIEAESIYV